MHKAISPMKSSMTFPSQYLPEGLWKKESPFGERSLWNAADLPPVSEFESPKLNMAGKLQLLGSPTVLLRLNRRPMAERMENAMARKAITVSACTCFLRGKEALDLTLAQMGLRQSIGIQLLA